ncbi:MAG: hypothetical protein K2N16_02490 [Muribaculaceae bacterium]|nr:hypothetical protein [Muribaculaceae bacterium]
MIRKRFLKITLLVLALAISLMALSIRNTNIVDRSWKVTSGASITGGMICIKGHECDYSYSYPSILKNGKIIAIALFQFDGRLVVFSTEYHSLSFLMSS